MNLKFCSLVCTILSLTLPAIADNFSVTNLANDSTPGSLLAAINAANASTNTPHTITFDSSLEGIISYSLSVLPPINRDTTIEGPGARAVTIRSVTGERQFSTLLGADLTLVNLKLESTGTRTYTPGTILGTGGAVLTTGDLTMRDCWVCGFNGERGGAARSLSNMTISRCTFNDNEAVLDGGALLVDNVATIQDSTFSGNSASSGGAISVISTTLVLIDQCTITKNEVDFEGAGVLGVNNFTQVSGCIVAGNCVQGYNDGEKQIGGTLSVSGNNLLAGDPQLYPLRNYESDRAPYHLPKWGSPAIDGGTSPSSTSDDGRGNTRPFPSGGNDDLGAIEVRSFQVTTTDFSMPGDPVPIGSIQEAISQSNAAGDRTDLIFLNVGATSYPNTESIQFQSELTMNRGSIIVGRGNISLRGGNDVRPFTIASGATGGFDKVTIEDARMTVPAGGLLVSGTAYLENTQVVDNEADCGGGIRVNGGILTLERCWIADNKATGTLGDSGGVEVLANGSVTARNTTFSNNEAAGRGGHVGAFGFGGREFHYCTFYGGKSGGFGNGDDIFATNTIVRLQSNYSVAAQIQGNEFVRGSGGTFITFNNVITQNFADVVLIFRPVNCVPFYRLTEFSTANGAARYDEDVAYDVEGRLRLSESPDAGASEYYPNEFSGYVSQFFTEEELCDPLGYLQTYGPFGDADNDGEPNWKELVLADSIRGSDTPRDPFLTTLLSNTPNPEFSFTSLSGQQYASLSFYYDRRMESLFDIRAGMSDDLKTWTVPSGPLVFSSLTYPYQFYQARSPQPLGTDKKTFFRVEAVRDLPLFDPVMVTVGLAGNQPDPSNSLGAVLLQYGFGKYEITLAAWVTFLNAVDPSGNNQFSLYSATQGVTLNSSKPAGKKYSTSLNVGLPVTNVDYYSCLRFCNWLHNGATRGANTEDGAYELLGGSGIPSNATTVSRRAGARFAIPSQDEWYKAAHQYTPSGAWDVYSTSSQFPPSPSIPGGAVATPANFANAVGNALPTGSYQFTTTSWGAKDTGGNVWEWCEASGSGGTTGLALGGAYDSSLAQLDGDNGQFFPRSSGFSTVGFRVVRLRQ
ncbi:MAG: SUMF1/EgtB/PvdO family nonheme iron enzyme [Verrucomicrobiota bacterium]